YHQHRANPAPDADRSQPARDRSAVVLELTVRDATVPHAAFPGVTGRLVDRHPLGMACLPLGKACGDFEHRTRFRTPRGRPYAHATAPVGCARKNARTIPQISPAA